MKKTFLMFNNPQNPNEGLRVATKEEWKQMLWDNRGLPKEKRRFFIVDSFEDQGTLDCMYIETTYEEYRKWANSYTATYRKRKQYEQLKDQIVILSLSEPELSDNEFITLEDTIMDEQDIETYIISEMLIKELRKALAKWNEWAPELLDFYLDGQGKTCNSYLMNKHGISDSLLRRRKRKFKEFVKKYLN